MGRFSIKGLSEFRKGLQAVRRDLPRRILAPAVRAGIEPLAAELRRQVPRESGALATTIQVVETADHGPNGVAMQAVIGAASAPAPYVAAVDLGTREQPGQHFAERAFDAAKARAAQVCVERITDSVDRELGGS